ncbi:TetR/AcrR family transcriptional regulator [Massilia luteola]|uniref:TetR/AcrR family transcriptional regulator n=1 Tax=Massilia luteola TaxID=3081751 RepID=UPI002ACC1EAE|nr:TetR/AcrR family transcriptional regulator [Massilia sp. Gc5]
MRVRTEAKRELILKTAGTAFMELGYEGTSMAEIAARVDCSKATLYGYFASKEELFLGVIAHGVGSAVDPLLDELFASAGDAPETVLRRFGERYLVVTLAPDAIAMKRLIIAQMSDPELARRFWELGPRRYLDALEKYMVAATGAGRLDVDDPKLAAQQLAALYDAETSSGGLFAGGQTFTREYITRIVTYAVRAFLRMYGSR